MDAAIGLLDALEIARPSGAAVAIGNLCLFASLFWTAEEGSEDRSDGEQLSSTSSSSPLKSLRRRSKIQRYFAEDSKILRKKKEERFAKQKIP
jgi:hypothetical protein